MPNVIRLGAPSHTVDGVPVAYEGHGTYCAAVLQSASGHFHAS